MAKFRALSPKQAIEMIEAAGVEDAARLIRDHSAAGLVRTYADIQVAITVDGQRTAFRDAAVSAELWERMVHDGVDGDAWSGGTVRLAGSDLIGGEPAVHITGISFNPRHVQRLAEQQRSNSQPAHRQPDAPNVADLANDVEPVLAMAARSAPNLAAIPPGAILCTIKQAGAALGLGRTKVNELMNGGQLERRMVGSSPRITVESVRAIASGD